jgi:post-segregation antitoxin (ccd killing protein)
MKNITVSVDDELYHRARVFAAQQKTSVSALVKKFLAEVAEEESEFERLKREEQELRARLFAEGRGLSSRDNLSREALYDRDAFR